MPEKAEPEKRTEKTEKTEKTGAAEPPKPDPLIMRLTQLKKEYEQLSRSLLNLKQQKSITDDMIYNTTMQMAGVQRATKELTELQKLER